MAFYFYEDQCTDSVRIVKAILDKNNCVQSIQIEEFSEDGTTHPQ